MSSQLLPLGHRWQDTLLDSSTESSDLSSEESKSVLSSVASGDGDDIISKDAETQIHHVARVTFEGDRSKGQLSFTTGSKIEAQSNQRGPWWLGRCGGRTGWFPASAVVPASEWLASVNSPLSDIVDENENDLSQLSGEELNAVYDLIRNPSDPLEPVDDDDSDEGSSPAKSRWLDGANNDISQSRSREHSPPPSRLDPSGNEGSAGGGSSDDADHGLDEDELTSLTVEMLKQRLKKRGLKVSGRKGALIDRLMGRELNTNPPPVAAETDYETYLNSLKKDELKNLLKEKQLKVSGNKAELIGRLMGRETQKVKDWKKSNGKRLLTKLCRDKNSWVHTMTPEEVHQSDQLFSCYPLSKFKEYLATLKAAIAAENEIVRLNEQEVWADLIAYPRGCLTDRGYPFWDNHLARRLLKDDVKNGTADIMKPKQLWESRIEYQEFPLSVFRDHIHQEKRRRREEPGWVVKRNKKAQKMHEAEVTAMKGKWDSTRLDVEFNEMSKRWESLQLEDDGSEEEGNETS